MQLCCWRQLLEMPQEHIILGIRTRIRRHRMRRGIIRLTVRRRMRRRGIIITIQPVMSCKDQQVQQHAVLQLRRPEQKSLGSGWMRVLLMKPANGNSA